jgi:hypothetical protein
MSGFLDGLLARHAGPLTVRPRAESRFATRVANLDLTGATSPLVLDDSRTEALAASPPATPQERDDTLRDEKRRATVRRATATARLHRVSGDRRQQEEPNAEGTPPATVSDASTPLPEGFRPTERTRPSGQSATGGGPLSAVLPGAALPSAAARGVLTRVVPPSEVSPGAGSAAAESPRAVLRRAVLSRAVSARPASPRPGAAAGSDARAYARADTIHVHIGRIEVRAVTPPPQAPSAQAPRSAHDSMPLSLEQYLSGAGRR